LEIDAFTQNAVPGLNGGCEIYTSTSPPAYGTGGFGPGYFEANIQADGATWDAWWMGAFAYACNGSGGANFQQGFESDIEEYSTVNIHSGGYGSCEQSWGPGTSWNISDTFHVIGMLWQPNGHLIFYRDGQVFWDFSPPGGAGDSTTNPGGEWMLLENRNFNNGGESGNGLRVKWVRYYHQ
jgi:hypothetical protein